jgi:hypothetical protein
MAAVRATAAEKGVEGPVMAAEEVVETVPEKAVDVSVIVKRPSPP